MDTSLRLLTNFFPSTKNLISVPYSSTIEGNPLAMWIYDRETLGFVDVNESALRQYGYERMQFLALTVRDLLPAGDFTTKVRPMSSLFNNKTTSTSTIHLQNDVHVHLKNDGTQIEVVINANDIIFRERPCRLVIAEDVTERRNVHALLVQMAHHDALTGLPNRVLLAERLEQALSRARQVGHKAAVVCIDLDRFKQINDWYGHSVGDECLKHVGTMLTARLRGMDTVARTGGEEFTAVLGEVDSVLSAGLVGQALLRGFSKPLSIDDRPLRLTGSIGIAVYPDHGEKGEELWRSADAAMYRAKRAGGKRSVVAGPDMSTAAEENAALDKHVRDMLDASKLELHYQLQYGPNQRIRGIEALLRLPQAYAGYVSPDRFVPQIEENGLIHPIGKWVIEEACRQLAVWNTSGKSIVKVAVNVSPLQLMRSDFAADVKRSLSRWSVDPSLLELEITERVFLNLDKIGRRINDLYAMGIRFAVDDFGVGYSSLQHLHRLPISTVKIDRSFVQRLCDPSGSYPIVEAIIAMGHSLNMEVIAEGVEDEQQRTALERLGCDAMQGFLFARPVPAETITDLLELGENQL